MEWERKVEIIERLVRIAVNRKRARKAGSIATLDGNANFLPEASTKRV